MFDRYFNLKENPFSETPDTRFTFSARSHEEVLKGLNKAHDQGRGFTIVTGEVGTGKTHLSRLWLKSLEPSTATALLLYTGLEGRDLMAAIAEEFGIKVAANAGLKSILSKITDLLVGNADKGRRAVVLIDEAQNLSLEALETIRVLSNVEQESFKLLHIVLVGQPELLKMLEKPEARQINQRISSRLQMGRLEAGELEKYIKHRIEIAGGNHYVHFKPCAVDSIFKLSDGVPRLVNMQCRQMLEFASKKEVRVLDHSHLIESLKTAGFLKPHRTLPWRREYRLVQA